jgi:glycosyltransferase involved in cell wall biosynthesis
LSIKTLQSSTLEPGETLIFKIKTYFYPSHNFALPTSPKYGSYMKSMFIPKYINAYLQSNVQTQETFDNIKNLYETNLVKKGKEPEITISIPAYNEEKTIIPTLISLCSNKTSHAVEIVVANNNSKDNTEKLVKSCGINCVFEDKQGIPYARNAGLAAAKGKYILNADADTLYPTNWIDEMVKPLIERPDVAITYGAFSLIPTGSTGRAVYYFYEMIAELSRFYNKYKKTEAVNVYGFTSGFRREQGLQVDGFLHPMDDGSYEDGYFALKLQQKGFGKMCKVNKAVAWTDDRRLQIDGGLTKGFVKRIKRVLNIN